MQQQQQRTVGPPLVVTEAQFHQALEFLVTVLAKVSALDTNGYFEYPVRLAAGSG